MFRVWGGGLKTLAVQSVGLHMEVSKIRAPHAKECRRYIQVYIDPAPEFLETRSCSWRGWGIVFVAAYA